MSHESLFAEVARYGVSPVITIDSVEAALPLADALLEGGLPVAEITFRTSAAAEVISLLARYRPELLVGAGTLLSAENVNAAKAAGGASPWPQDSIRPLSDMLRGLGCRLPLAFAHRARLSRPLNSAAESSSSFPPSPAAGWRWSRHWRGLTPIPASVSCRLAG